MARSKEIILPVILAVILLAIPVWFFVNYLGELLYYQELSKNGVETGGTLIDKGIDVGDGELMKPYVTSPSDNHRFVVSFDTDDHQLVRCRFGVSKSTYDIVSKRDKLSIIYLPSDPSDCTLPGSVNASRYLLFVVLTGASFFVLVAGGFFYYIHRSFKTPATGNEVKPTSNLDLPGNGLDCPRCGEKMTEGYMPTVGGICWRDRDEPVGIPTMLSGLPGTTSWIRRPKLHGFRCENCKIITFKYGNKYGKRE